MDRVLAWESRVRFPRLASSPLDGDMVLPHKKG